MGSPAFDPALGFYRCAEKKEANLGRRRLHTSASARANGPLKYLIGLLGIPPQKWLLDLKLALPSVVGMQVWSTLGYYMVLWLAGLQGVPQELYDAAKIDGANRFGIYWRVLLPLIKPTLATLATLTFLGQWNAFMWPLIMTNSAKMRLLTVGLSTLVVREGGAGVSMASATLSLMPTLLIFLFMQRYVVQGIALSGVKG